MSPYGLSGKLFTAPENRDALIAILSEASAAMQALDGCYLYMVSKDADDDTATWVTEVWENQQAHDDAVQSADVQAMIGKGMPLIVGAPEGATLIPVAGAPTA